MPRLLLLRGLFLVVSVVLLSPSEASAKILITRGDVIKHIGNVAEQQRQFLAPAVRNQVAVGFKYSYFGIFWLDLWTWGGEYCIYQGDKYEPLTPTQAAILLNTSESELSTPFLYKCPLGLAIVVVAIAVIVPVTLVQKQRAKRRFEEHVRDLFQDERYQKALDVMAEEAKKQEAARAQAETEAAGGTGTEEPPPADGGFEAAVQHLISKGVPREEAEANLRLMLSVLEASDQQQTHE
jgi:hypothetical protein